MKCCVALSECLLFSCCTRKCSATDLLDCDTCHVLLKLRKADIHCYSDVRTSFHGSWYDRMKCLHPACSGPLEVSAFLHSSLPACCLWLFLRKLKLFIKSPRLLILEDDLASAWITLSWCCLLPFCRSVVVVYGSAFASTLLVAVEVLSSVTSLGAVESLLYYCMSICS